MNPILRKVRGGCKLVWKHDLNALGRDSVLENLMSLRLVAVAACLGLVPRTLAAQTAIIEGRVTTAPAGRPAAAAEVRIEGTSLVAVTDTAGRYRMGPVPPGPQVLVVRKIGYAPARDYLAPHLSWRLRDSASRRLSDASRRLAVRLMTSPSSAFPLPVPGAYYANQTGGIEGRLCCDALHCSD